MASAIYFETAADIGPPHSALQAFFRLVQAVREVGQELIFARDHVAQFVDACFQAWIVDAFDKFIVAHHQQQ